jgi:predicted TPR repeat methyltransferase
MFSVAYCETSNMTPWYETLFANFGKTCDKESFTQGTVGEVDFVERELEVDRSKRIPDIGCGTGRHAIELAKRGYRVTGFDLSEGAFPLMETDEKNYAILTHAAAALHPGGRLLLTTLNAPFPLFHSVKDFLEAGKSGTATGRLTFDVMTFREHSELTLTGDAGRSQTIETNERYDTPAEMRWLLQTAGFTEADIFGCRLGQFSREHVLTIHDFEMLVVAEKDK